tara:strand:+ start:232 stop:402 length:171 start_codon:yes stop_codon:yes gene_type:complete
MAKKHKFKVGDKVNVLHWTGVFTIVSEIEGRFAVENWPSRLHAKSSDLTLIIDTEE